MWVYSLLPKLTFSFKSSHAPTPQREKKRLHPGCDEALITQINFLSEIFWGILGAGEIDSMKACAVMAEVIRGGGKFGLRNPFLSLFFLLYLRYSRPPGLSTLMDATICDISTLLPSLYFLVGIFRFNRGLSLFLLISICLLWHLVKVFYPGKAPPPH